MEAEMKNNMAVIRFADTGTGISPGDLPRVFDRFVKADHARDRSVKGSGLGLSIVRKIIELHGGTIQIDSELDRGTVVTVSFPGGTE
ncbi:Signal transduction histidine-protein kinase ArlS [compost metagenome]